MFEKIGSQLKYTTLLLILYQLQNIATVPSQYFEFLETDSRSLIMIKQLLAV